ncbi:universal stress protein [Palleronia sp. LCG004]|uniref:universal stress protein n=1 Tax=Palleronia sp. LCG004 TaxID=3079304 RepID=UPI002943EEE4|nr:universal stress protein [Palleronia sp. LCG004]WOI55916.1 universal stress protein [Palleronia sp. LCG004]
MTRKTYVVAYEGDADGTRVLDYAISQAAQTGARLNIVHILEWSPYRFLTKEEVEERHVRRSEELARASDALMEPALEKARAAGVEAIGTVKFGSVVPLVAATVTDSGAELVFVGRSGAHNFGARIFGSVPLGLAQIATVPTVIVP